MSAFIVNDSTIHVLVALAFSPECPGSRFRPYNMVEGRGPVFDSGPGEPDELGQILLNENYRSVNHRYQQNLEPHKYRYETPRDPATDTPTPPNPVQVLKAANCLAYQSCETEDYYSTDAYWILDAIKEKAIRILPGYRDAEWDLVA